MSEDGAPVDVEVVEPPHEYHKTGHGWVDKVLPVSALFVSLISILIAYHHSQVMKELVNQNAKLVQANSLPWLSSSVTYTNNGDSLELRRTLTNNGVGPAEVRFAQLSLDGKPVDSYEALLRACCGLQSAQSNSGLTGNMVRQGSQVDYLTVRSTSSTREQVQRYADASFANRIALTVCYCSVFNECWMLTTAESRPARVRECPPARQGSPI